MEAYKVILSILGIIIAICLISLGWIGGDIYREYKNDRILNGLWFGSGSYTEIREKAYNLDDSGEWVCINIDEKMNYNTIVKTCEHEASHELFARKCTKNETKCLEIMGE